MTRKERMYTDGEGKEMKQQSVRVLKKTLDMIRPVAWARKYTMLETLNMIIMEWVSMTESKRRQHHPDALSLEEMTGLYNRAGDQPWEGNADYRPARKIA